MSQKEEEEESPTKMDPLELIAKKIEFGGLKTKKRIGKGVGRYCRVLFDIYDLGDNILKHHYSCDVCKEVIFCNTNNGSATVNRHADVCDPPPQAQKGNIVEEKSANKGPPKRSKDDSKNAVATNIAEGKSDDESPPSKRFKVDSKDAAAANIGEEKSDDESPPSKRSKDDGKDAAATNIWTTKFSNDRQALSEVISSASHIFSAFGPIDSEAVYSILKRNCTGNLFLNQLTKEVKRVNNIAEPEDVLDGMEDSPLNVRSPSLSLNDSQTSNHSSTVVGFDSSSSSDSQTSNHSSTVVGFDSSAQSTTPEKSTTSGQPTTSGQSTRKLRNRVVLKYGK